MADPRDEMPPAGPTDFYPDFRPAGPDEQQQESLARIARALEGLLAEVGAIRAFMGAKAPEPKAPPTPEWPPKVET